MKKFFTLAAVACMAMSVNAQDVWTVNTPEGTLKAEYVPNSDASAMSVVSFSTTNVEGTHTSGPVAGYIDAETTPLEPKVDNTWGGMQTKALSSDGSVAPIYYVSGKGNPVNINNVEWEEVITDGYPTGMYRPNWEKSYYVPDGSAGLPKNGTYITLTPKVAGTLKVTVWINKGSRDVYVVKASDAKALALGTEVIASGYINGQNNDVEDGNPLKGYPMFQENIAAKGTEDNDAYVVGVGNQAYWGYLTFAANANETYYIFNKNTQIGFGGFEFTAGSTGINDVTVNAGLDKNAPIYNLAGQRVGKDAKGILIQNGRKFIK
ncbi:hypothetical protein [Xylanibacter caecicola]|uniref:hypothetical protein n=1 Tax=Xylanibacter caecicola TaxID=2736294 RepID=UPI00259226D1|nr:hypothetical protein [Xylanibacter caecicola]